MTNHPITPPPELVQQWASAFYGTTIAPGEAAIDIATQAANWGSDQELEACLVEVSFFGSRVLADKIRAARRPKPPSLKEQARDALGRFFSNAHTHASQMTEDFDLLRRAVEALDD